MKRVFILDKQELSDPNQSFTPAEVKDFYANQYGELLNATVHGPKIEEDRVVFTFKATIGTKG